MIQVDLSKVKKVKNSIYRFLNEDKEIIYIGKASDLKKRLNGHSHLPEECYTTTKQIQYTVFETEDECLYAEKYYISKLKPIYNTIYKDIRLLFDIQDFDNKVWTNINEYEKITKKSITAMVKEKKYLLDELEEKWDFELLRYRDLMCQLYKKEKELDVDISKLYDKDRKEALSIFPLYEEYLDASDKQDELYTLKEGLKNEIYELVKKGLNEMLGDEEYSKITEGQFEYFVKYAVFTKEEVIKSRCEEITRRMISITKSNIEEKGFYDYTDFCIMTEMEFTLGRSHETNKEWLYFVDDEELIKARKPLSSINKLIRGVMLKVEDELTKKYGAFTQEILVQNSVEPIGEMCGVINSYPNVKLIKRPISLKNKFRDTNMAVVVNM